MISIQHKVKGYDDGINSKNNASKTTKQGYIIFTFTDHFYSIHSIFCRHQSKSDQIGLSKNELFNNGLVLIMKRSNNSNTLNIQNLLHVNLIIIELQQKHE